MNAKWYDKPMLISAVQHNYSDSYEILHNHTAKHFNTEQLYHLYAEDAYAHYDDEKHGEKLREYLAESRKYGISEIVYTNVHSIEPENADPKWLIVNEDGSHRYLYDIQYALCLNDDYTTELVRQLARLAAYDINGIFLDGPISTGACFCPHCKKLFSETFGKDISNASATELMRFNLIKVKKFMKACHDTIKSVNPDIILYINNSALRADITGSNTREIYDYVDFLGAEGGFVWTNREISHWHLSPMAKLIETQAQEKPAVTFIAGDCKPWSFVMHTPEETEIFYAQAVANGTNVWYGLHCPIDRMKTEAGKRAMKFNHFILNNPEIFTKHKPVSNVALLWGQDTANYYRSSVEKTDFTDNQTVGVGDDAKSDHSKSFHGCVEMLSRAHIQYDVIDEVSILLGELKKYDLLIMPTVACLRDGVAEKTKEFVKEGGNLVSFYDTGFYNGDGTPAKEPQLKKLQGIEKLKRAVHYKVYGGNYIQVKKESLYSDGFSFHCLPGYNYVMDVTPVKDAEVYLEACEPMPSRYVPYPTAWFPAVVETEYGKGKSVYFTGDLGEAFLASSNPDMSRLFVNTVSNLSRPVVTTDAPGSVEMVLRKCKEGYALHIINITGEMTHPITRIIELPNIRVTLSLSDIKGELKSLTGDAPINVEKTDGKISFTLPLLKTYDVITVK